MLNRIKQAPRRCSGAARGGLLTLAPAFLLLACSGSSSDLGSFCFIGVDDTAMLAFSIEAEHPDCRSGFCVKQGGYRCADGSPFCPDVADREKVQPYCSHSCRRDADCSPASGGVNGCSRYVCAHNQGPTAGPGCACLCLDYVRDEDGEPLDLASFDASSIACDGSR